MLGIVRDGWKSWAKQALPQAPREESQESNSCFLGTKRGGMNEMGRYF